MLILSRKINESIVIDGRITVKVVRVEGDVVKLGVEAPADVPVHRQEVYEEIQRNNSEALTQGRPMLPQLPTAKTLPVAQPKKNFKGPPVAGTPA
jgi:carbon storage regulator